MHSIIYAFHYLCIPLYVVYMWCGWGNPRPSEKRFQTAFVCHAYDYALLGKANRTYAGMNVESEAMPSEKVSDGFLCAMRTITLC